MIATSSQFDAATFPKIPHGYRALTNSAPDTFRPGDLYVCRGDRDWQAVPESLQATTLETLLLADARACRPLSEPPLGNEPLSAIISTPAALRRLASAATNLGPDNSKIMAATRKMLRTTAKHLEAYMPEIRAAHKSIETR